MADPVRAEHVPGRRLDRRREAPRGGALRPGGRGRGARDHRRDPGARGSTVEPPGDASRGSPAVVSGPVPDARGRSPHPVRPRLQELRGTGGCVALPAPKGDGEALFHWHLEITPHLTETAGFERGSGFYINPVVPEDAAAILRGEVRWSDRAH